MTENIMKGQMLLSDLDGWYGKMYQELSAQTGEKISEQSLKKPQKWQKGMPAYLDLRGGDDGHNQAVSWEQGGLLLGVYMMRSFGEYPREENVSRLSQILEEAPHPKYCLSARACQGILNRAKKRGKELPEILEKALRRQSVSKNEQEKQGGGKGILIQNEHTGALSTLNNQSVCYGIEPIPINTMVATRVSDEKRTTFGVGEEGDPQFTIQSAHEHAVCCSQDAYDKFSENENSASLKACGGTYGGGARR